MNQTQMINSLQVEVSALRVLVEDVKMRTDHHEKILVVGYEEHLPLAEVVRNLTNTVGSYIAQKDKEEQNKKDQWNRFKWVVIPIIVSGVIAFIIQAIVFFFRVYPIIEKLSQ